MELVTKNKAVKLVFTTRKIVNVTNILKGKNFEELYFKAMNESDLDALSKIIYAFSEDEAGLKSFKTNDEVYDFIDDYKEETGKSYKDIFEELAGTINDEGFFSREMSKKELKNRISNPLLGMNMEDMLKSSAEKAVSKIIEQQASQELMA